MLPSHRATLISWGYIFVIAIVINNILHIIIILIVINSIFHIVIVNCHFNIVNIDKNNILAQIALTDATEENLTVALTPA